MTDATPSDDAPQRTHRRVKRGLVRLYPRWCLGIYIFLLIASNIVDWQADEARIVWGNMYLDRMNAQSVEVDTTGLAVNVNPLEYRVIVEGDPDSTLPPVVLLHGSPGAANGFQGLAPLLTDQGRRVIYMDLPGFGSQNEPWSRGSVFEDYSSRAYAQIMWRLLDAMGDQDRVHIVGWSNGGAVGLRMIEQHPDRVATLTLLAAVGAQENEGTGSYAFEHFKYKAGRAILVYGAHLFPHFGLPGPMGERNAFLRFFDDTDQRDLGGLMERIDTPTMIMHGRHDFLISDRAAEDHYQRMHSAQLVMLDAMHFIPFTRPSVAAEYLNPFFNRHDDPGVTALTSYTDLAPIPARSGFDHLLHESGRIIDERLAWWVVLILLTLLIRLRPNLGVALATLLMAMMRVDFAVVLLAILTGRTWWLISPAMFRERPKTIDRPWTVLGWMRSVLFFAPAFAVGTLGAVLTLILTDRIGLVGFLLSISLTTFAILTLRLVVTWEGRQRIKAQMRRFTSHEYYPSGLLYITVLWAALMRILSGKGLRALTAVNPGYADDGGLREERKSVLDSRFSDDPAILRCALVDEDQNIDRRISGALQIIKNNERLGGMPIIAKPDQGERGRGVRLINSPLDMREYCTDHPEPFVLQRYHPGPVEVGVLWVRHTETIEQPKEPAGFIYTINKKVFPVLIGDGQRSIRHLILHHPRYRAQSRIFIEHMRAKQHLIPDEGERVELGYFGNHSQGAMFSDGGDLITPELSARIDQIASSFKDEQGRGFDIGRFDIRCPSYESLMRGEELGIVELNGLTSEPTNLYDPDRSIFWAWGLLLGYWRHVERLSAARIEHGSAKPISREDYRTRMMELVRVMAR